MPSPAGCRRTACSAGIACGDRRSRRLRGLGRARRPLPPRRAVRAPGAKPEAVYIGFAARAAAARGALPIAERLAQLADELAEAAGAAEQLERDDQQAAEEWRRCTDRRGAAAGASRGDARGPANSRPPASDSPRPILRCARGGAGRATARAAAGRATPPISPAGRGRRAAGGRDGARRYLRRAGTRSAKPAQRTAACRCPSCGASVARERGARRLRRREERSPARRIEAEEAARVWPCCARPSAPRSRNCSAAGRGAKPSSMRANVRLKAANAALREGGEARAVAGGEGRGAAGLLVRSAARRAPLPSPGSSAFAATGLLLAACPRLELPDIAGSLDDRPGPHPGPPHRAGADRDQGRRRRPGTRVQTAGRRRTATELQRGTERRSATRRTAETSDWGFVVHDRLSEPPRAPRPARRRASARRSPQRSELLTAKEREVLENHLQAEIAAEDPAPAAGGRTPARPDQRRAAQPPDLHRRALPPAVAAARAKRRARPSASKRRASACSTPAPICGRPKTAASSAPCCSSASPPSASAPMPVPRRDGGSLARPAGARARLSPLAPFPRRALAGRPLAQAVRSGLQRRARARPHGAAVRRGGELLPPGRLPAWRRA